MPILPGVDQSNTARSGTFSRKRERSANATSRVAGFIILSSRVSGEIIEAIKQDILKHGL